MPAVLGEFSVQVDCGHGADPMLGDLVRVKVLGRRLTLEVVRVARYRVPVAVDGGRATHFVRLRPRRAYVEE